MRLIFCHTPGRSGTGLLSRLFSVIPEIHSDHEPSPSFAEYWRKIISAEYTYKEFWDYKLRRIRSIPRDIYIETSHMACKGYLLNAPVDMPFETIFLVRNNRDVAKSLYELGDIPGRTKTGIRYLYNPDTYLPSYWKHLTDYQLCYWYTLYSANTMAQWTTYCSQHNIPHAFVRFESLVLSPIKTLQELCRDLCIPFALTDNIKMEIENIMKNKINQKIHRKTYYRINNKRYREEEIKVEDIYVSF